MRIHPVTSALAAAALSAALAGSAAAQGAAGDAAPLTAQQVTSKLEAAGYTGVHDLEWDDGAWEADAFNPQGKPVDLVIDPRSGAVLKESAD